jgi:DNA polymerase IIIc chi subunit
MTNIIFIPVKDTPSKLAKLCQLAQKHLLEKEPLLLLAADKASFEFLDKLLWSTPPDGFLPHPTKLLSISLELDAHFHTVFNLRPVPLADTTGIKTIFEFEDHTSSEKLQLSKQRYQHYRDNNFPLIIDNQ